MTERQEITKRYNVVAINLSFPDQGLFLKGNWDGSVLMGLVDIPTGCNHLWE